MAIRVYLDGTMIVFATQSGIIFSIEPRGSISIKPTKTGGVPDGMAFVKQVTGEVIASVPTYSDVLNSAGVAYGANFNDTISALNEFMGTPTQENSSIYYDIEETFETGPIIVSTPVYSYPTVAGQVVSIEVTALARRSATGSTGVSGKWVIFGSNSAGTPVLGPLAVDYTSVTYAVAISFSASGSNILVNAGINGALPIYWTGIIKIKQLNP